MATQEPVPKATPELSGPPPENRLTITWKQIEAEGAPLADIVGYLRDQHLRLTQPLGVVRENDGRLASRLDFAYNPQQVAPARLEGMVRGLEEIGKGYGLRVFDDFDDTRLTRERRLQELPDAKWHVLTAQTDLKREIAPGREWSQDAQHLAQFMQPELKTQIAAQQPAAPVQAAVEVAPPAPQPTPAGPGPDRPGTARAAELVSESQAPSQAAPRPKPAPAGGVGELLVRWQQQGDQVAPLTELRAYLDSLKQAGVAVGAMQLERGPEGKLRGQFGVSYDPAAPDLAPLEGAVQGLKKVGHGLEVVEAPAQAAARRQGLGQAGQERALDLAFPVREAFGIRQWDALSAQLSQVPPAALTAPERAQQQAGAARVAQVAEQQGKTHEQVVREGKSLLLDVDTSGNPVSAFLRNFYEHLHGAPKTRQTLEVDYEHTRQQLQARLTRQAGGTPAPEQAAPAAVATPVQGPAVAGPAQAPATAPAVALAPPVPAQPAPAPRFTAGELPTEKLALFGLSAEQLAGRGQLQKLLEGQKTDLLAMRAGGGQPGQPAVQFDGKLLLHREANGTVTLRLDLPRQQLEIPREIAGQALTEAQRQRLQAEGTAGLVRGLRDPQGQPYNGFVGVDPVMRRLVVLPEKAVTFHDTIAGVKLSAEQSRDLREGKAVELAQMRRPGGGRPFDGTAQVQAARAGVEVRPAPYERKQRQQAAQPATQKATRQRKENPRPASPKPTRKPRP